MKKNPFKASYLVTLTDLKLSSEVQENIYKLDNIASITSQDNTINNLVKIANGIKNSFNSCTFIISNNINIYHSKYN